MVTCIFTFHGSLPLAKQTMHGQQKKLRLKTTCPAGNVYFDSTYNIFDLDNIIKNLRKYQLPIETNFVHSPEHYDIRHIPGPVKKILSNRIFNSKSKTLLDQTLPGCDVQWPIFCQEVTLLDKIRNQNFADVFPEWYSLLKPFMHG
jgi:hypothetical protein